MESWRYSYDAQKTKLMGGVYKTHMFPAFLAKQQTQKRDLKKNTEIPRTLKQTKSLKISPLKSVQNSKSPLKPKILKYSPFKSPKQHTTLKTNINCPQQRTLNEYKSTSTITQDSDSNEPRYKTIAYQRCPMYPPKDSLVFEMKKQNKQREKTLIETMPVYSPGRVSHRNGIKGRCVTQKTIQKDSESGAKQEIKINDFMFLTQLGRGHNSVVYLARHKTLGMLFAIKILLKSSLNSSTLKQNTFRQLKIHSYLKHPNLVSLTKILQDQKFIYMILQYATNGTLYSQLKRQKKFTQQKTARIVKDICHGLKYLHDNHIIHRDLKLENILISEGVAKIGDFGCAVYGLCMRKSQIGSPAYLAPEQINQNFYGKKIDIWSLGIMVYEMLFEATPFDKQIMQALTKGEYNCEMKIKFPVGAQISDQARNFIQKCLQRKQNNRMDINQVLSHPFLKLDEMNNKTYH